MADKVFINGRAAVQKSSAGKSVAFPDVCLCPPGPPAGPVPVPLPNTVVAADLDGGATSVLIEGNPAGTRRSFFRKSTGNEVSRATGGGLLTGAVQGKAHFRFGHSFDVFFEGEPAVRHGDPITHNHVAFPGNTPPAPWLSALDPAVPRKAPSRVVRDQADGTGWIDIHVLDEAGRPVATRYELRTPSGKLAGRLLSGGALSVRGMAKGPCTLVLADVDDRCAAAKRREPAKVEGGQLAYRPGSPVSMDAGKKHELVAPGMVSFWVDLPIRARDAAARDDRFVLRSKDGSYEVVRTVKDDRVREDEGLTLEFPALRKGLEYTLLHDTGADGLVYAFFEDRSFDELFPREPSAFEEPEPARPVRELAAGVDPSVTYIGEDFEDDSDLPPEDEV